MPDWLHAFLTFQVVAVVAGSIAYLGNQLGRKIGKRKMTVFKMRPRHTSNFMTALIGIVIAWTTLGVASIFSEPVRGLIIGVDYLREEEARLRNEISDLEDRLRKGQVVWGAAAVYLAISLYFAFRAVTCAPKVERALVDLLTPFGLQGEGAQVAINGLLTCQVPPDRFLQQLAKVLSGQTGPSHRFQGQVQGNCFSFRVPGLQALRATEVHQLFQGTVSSSDQQTSQIRWSLGGTGIRWHEEVAAVVGVTIVLVLVKVPLLLAFGMGMAGMAVRWLLAASLIADQLKGLEEEAAILLQWCADHS